MRIVFLSSGGLLGEIVLRRLMESGRFELAGVVRSRRVMTRTAGFFHGAIKCFSRCGIIYTVYIWAITTLAEFVGLLTGVGSITSRARRAGIPVLHTRDVNNEEGVGFVRSFEPALLVTAHFDQILGPWFCQDKGWTAVNIHPSLLPAYKGLEPVLHLLAEGGEEFGVTLHRIADSVDSGPVLAARAIPGPSSLSVLRMTYGLMQAGADLLVNCPRETLIFGTGTPQTGAGSYRSWPGGKQIHSLYARGKHLLRISDLVLWWRRG